MKTFSCNVRFVAFIVFVACFSLFVGLDVFPQCGTPSFKANAGWCDNYYAKWELNAAVPAGTKYHWYYDDNGVTKDAGYGPKGNGSEISTPFRCNSNDGSSVTMMYAKEGLMTNINPSEGHLPTNNIQANSSIVYTVGLETPYDIQLESFSMPMKIYYCANFFTATVSFVASNGTTVATATHDFSSTVNDVVILPINKLIPAGTYTVKITTTNNNGNYGYADNQISDFTDSYGIKISSGTNQNKYSMLYDWNYTVICDKKESPAANLRTSNCCDPIVGRDVALSATLEYIESGQSTDLTVTHYNSANNYFVWYKDGVQLNGATGKGKLNYTVDETGVYSVREVGSMTYKDEASCYQEGVLEIQNRFFSVRNNDAAATHCLGSKVELEAVPKAGAAVARVDWSPAALFANPVGTKAIAELSSEGDIVIEAAAMVLEDNKTLNGNFEAGTTGFTSEYTVKTDGTTIPDGNNALLHTDASTGYVGWVNNFNGTGQSQEAAYWTQDGTKGGKKCTGDGKFLTIDGKSEHAGRVVWEQTVSSVTPNKDYEFSMDVANVGWGSLETNPFTMGGATPLEVYMNDVLLFRTAPNDQWCSWQTRTETWNSGSSTSAKITIKQYSPATNGNDFAIDNIYLGTPRVQKDTVKLQVTDCYDVEIENNNCVLTARAVNTATGEEVGQVDHWLDATGTIVGYGNTLDVSDITTAKTTYKAVAYFPSGSVITNGDFELGMSGFKYGNGNGLYDKGNQVGSFTILQADDIRNTACGDWCVRVPDNVSGSGGNMLYVDPRTVDGDVIAYDFTAVKDKAYILSLFFANACRFTDRNPLPISAQLSFIVKDNATGTREEIITKQLSENNDWEDLSAVWTAPSDGSFTLYIRAAGDETLTIQDNVNPENSRSGGNDFVIDDISFATSLDKVYEGEIEVSPCIECKEPTAVTLTPSGRTDGYMCDGETVTLTTNEQVNTTDFQFDWYQGETIEDGMPVTNKTARTGIKSDSYAISDIEDADTYWVRVSDAHYPDMDACWKEQSFTITPAEKPTVEITGGAEYCEGDAVSAPVFTFTGSSPYKFRYAIEDVAGTVLTTSNWVANYTENTYSPTVPEGVGNYIYKVIALEDALCTADETELNKQSTRITILPQPRITMFESSGNACEGTELSITLKLQSSQSAGCMYSYTDYNGEVQTGGITVSNNDAQKIVISDAATVAHSGRYSFDVYLVSQCADNKFVDVTIYPNPTIDNIAISSEAMVCSGTEISFTPTVTDSDSGVGTFSWSGTETGTDEVLKVTKTVSEVTEVKETLTYTSSHNCSVTSDEVMATIYPIPDAPETIDDSWCKNSTADPVRATIETDNIANWFDADHNPITGATPPTPSTASATEDGNPITYYVSQTAYKSGCFAGCTSQEAEVHVVVNNNLSPNIIATKEAFCKKLSTELSLDKTYKTQKWMLNTTSLGTDATCTFGSDKNPGTYTISVDVTDENECTGSATKDITIYKLPVATLTPEEDIKICDLTSATITATITDGEDGNGPYEAVGSWSENATKIDDFHAKYTANGEGAKTVEYHYVSTYGCEFDAPIPSKKINVIAIPSAVADWTVTYCEKASASALEAPATATGVKWYDGVDATEPLAGAPTPSTDAHGEYYYYMTQKPDICESAKTKITVLVNALPTPEIISKVAGVEKDNACYGTAIDLSLDAAYKSQKWSCSPTDNLSSTTDAAPTLKATAPEGTYTIGVVVEDNNKCKNLAEVTKTLVVHPIPEASLSVLTAKCADDETAQTITATITPDLTGDGTWTGDVENTSDVSASFVPKTAGDGNHTITYEFKSEAGCEAEPVETSVMVYAMPDITITPSLANVCEQGGATSGTVSLSMTGTYSATGAQTPTYNYTSTTLSSVDAATGTFTSVGQSSGVHTIGLQYTDANGCKGSASTEVTIFARPVVDFDLPTAICDYAQALTLAGKVKYEDGDFTSISGGQTSFTGTGGVLGTTFTPTGLFGSKDVTLAYTDDHGCKSENVSHSIVVNHTDAPVPVSNSDSKLNVTNQASVPLLSANGQDGATYKWYLANDTTQATVAQTQTYQIEFDPDADGKMKEGQYPAYVTQTLNGCQSVPTQAILTITDCPVTPPTAAKYYACVEQDGIEVTAVSTYANPETDDTKTIGWFWDNTQIPVTTIDNLAAANPDGTGTSFTIPKSKLGDAGNVTIYVAEYDGASGKECFSPATAVTVEVHANPQPTITVPDVICSTESQIDVAYGPASSADGKVTSTLTAEQGTISDNKTWSLYFDESVSSITDTRLTVTTEEVWGTGSEQVTCRANVSEVFSVTHVNAPTGTGIGTPQVWSSSAEKLPLIPDMVIDYAHDLSAVLSVTDQHSIEVGTSSPISMKQIITAEGSYEYNVQQSVNGCKSPVAVSVWNIVDCPTPAPTVESVTICSKTNTLEQTALPTLVAENAGNQTDEWLWYSDAEGTQQVGSAQNLVLEGLAGYTSNVTEKTVYTFYVKQNGNDGTGGSDMCFGPLSAPVTVTIHPNPVVVIADMPVLCYYDETKTAKATVNGNDLATLTSGNGSWKFLDGSSEVTDGIAETGEINLQVKGETDGNYTIQYEYTDANNCYGKETKAIEIEFAETPTTEEVKRLTIDETDVEVEAGNISSKPSTTVNWYNMENDQNVVSNDNPWKTGDVKSTEIRKSYFVSQTIQGCESKKQEQVLSIILCPFEAPHVADVQTCQGLDFDAIEASTAETVDSWLWYQQDSNGDLQPLSNNNAVFNPTASINEVATTTYFVSYLATESKTGKQCESKKAQVTAKVLPLPTITFEGNPSMVCYDLGERQLNVQVDYHQNGAGSGAWSVDGEPSAISDGGEFKTNFKAVADEAVSEDPSYVVRYTYTDGMSCENTETMPLRVRYVAKPVLSHHYTMTSQNIDGELSATLDAGETVRWYVSREEMRVASTDNPWKTGDKGTIEVHKTYFASQVVEECESQRAETTVDIVPCPIPAPSTVGNEMCNYDEVKELTATAADWAGRPQGTPELFYLYNANNEKIDENETGVFVPTVDTSSAQVLSFYISEYNSRPIETLTIQAGCESPKQKVELTIKKTMQASVSVTKESVCEFPVESNPDFSAQGYVGNGTYYWYEEDPQYPNCQPSSEVGMKYKPYASEVGTHSVWLVVNDNGCYSVPVRKDFTIKAIPEKPEVTPNEVCEDDPNVAVSAVSEQGYITWYSKEDCSPSSLLRKNSATYISLETFRGEYQYYATQTVDGCESPASEVTYRIKARPFAPKIVTNEYHYCEYDTPPTMKAVAEPETAQIRWYLSDKKTYANADMEQGLSDEYTLDALVLGKNMLYASQINEGCEGAYAPLSFYVYAKPSSPVVNNATMCEGATAIPTLSTNLFIDKWYSDSLATKVINTGYTYTPDSSIVKDKDLTYYIVREQNQCFSDTVPVTLFVVKTPTIYLGEDTAFCIYDTLSPIVATVTPAIAEGSTFNWYISPNPLGKSVEAADTFNIETYKNTLVGKTVDYTVRAQYIVKISDNLTCKSAYDTVHYVVNERGRTPIVFSNVICEDVDIVPLRALGSPNVTWKSLDGILPEEWHGQKYEFTRGQEIVSGIYRFMVWDEDMETGCLSESDTLEMTVAPAAKTKIIGEDSTCTKNTLTYYSQYSEGSTYYWGVTGNVLNYSKENMSSSVRYFDFTDVGIDTITLYERTWAGCEGFDTLVVAVGPTPEVDFSWSLPGESNIIELVDSTRQDTLWRISKEGELVGEVVPYTLFWNYGHFDRETGTEIDTVVPYERRHFPIQEGGYLYGFNCPTLTVENTFGCRNSNTQCVFVNLVTSLYVPTAFSPTNPAHSVRTFQPKGFNLQKCEISVYDKWGNMVWFSNDVKDGLFVGYWDGRCDGKLMAAGEYFWKMEATFIDGQTWDGFDSGNGKKSKYGSVLLLR